MDIMDTLLKELESLPQDCQLTVLTYIRLLKLGMAPQVGDHEACDDAVERLHQYAEVDRRTS